MTTSEVDNVFLGSGVPDLFYRTPHATGLLSTISSWFGRANGSTVSAGSNGHLLKRQCPRSKASENARRFVFNAIKDRVDVADNNSESPNAFYVADVGEVYRQYLRWKTFLRRVKPHYAVKVNPDPEVLRLLASLDDVGFDCASQVELDMILKLGVSPSRIIFAHPCKPSTHLQHAKEMGVKRMTFDNTHELHKIKRLAPDAELFLRFAPDDSGSSWPLSAKFGAHMNSIKGLLCLARELDLNLVGVSFHVGSGVSDLISFARAVQDSRRIFDEAAKVGFDLRVLDVGDGFSTELFEASASILLAALDLHFPPSIEIVSESGRYFVFDAFTIACNIIGRRDPVAQSQPIMLYLNDGVYGSFSSVHWDYYYPEARVLKCASPGAPTESREYSLWGPTCDSGDCIAKKALLKEDLGIGDWLYSEEMGAYTSACGTHFNGFASQLEVVYVSSEPATEALLGY